MSKTRLRQDPTKDIAPAQTKSAALWHYPDAAVLAHLVAQPRFASLSDEKAIGAALLLLHKCQTAINHDSYVWDKAKEIEDEAESIPKPALYPAYPPDFYRLVVRAKDKGHSQRRFFMYLESCFHGLKAFGYAGISAQTETGWAMAELARLENEGFTEREWYYTAIGYGDWWKSRCRENKRHAVRERVKKYRDKKKTR